MKTDFAQTVLNHDYFLKSGDFEIEKLKIEKLEIEKLEIEKLGIEIES